MPFKFKLSRRLAQIYYPAALLGAALAACRVADITTSDPPTLGVASLEISPNTLTVNVGDSGQLTAIVRDAAGHAVNTGSIAWASRDTAVALLNQSGLVTGQAEGTVEVSATGQGKSATASVRVSRAPVASVEVSPATARAAVGETVRLQAVTKDKNGRVLTGRTVSWTTGNGAVAEVTDGGLVTGKGAGSVTVTATSEGKSGTTAITVTIQPVASVTVNPATASLALGQTVQLAATVNDVSGNLLAGQPVTWSSSGPAVASVSPNGLVSGVGVGAATITATSGGVAGTAALTVTATTPGMVTDLAVVDRADSGLTLAFTEVNDGTGQPASYDVRYAVGTLTWGSTAPSVTLGTCTTPVAGTTIGARRTCTVLGLTPGTSYQLQLVAFRGTLRVNAVFGGLSNLAQATTTGATGTGTGPHPGATDSILVQDGFEGGTLGPWQQIPDNGRYSVTTTAARVHSGTHAAQVLFTPTNGYGMLTRWFMPGYDEVYVKFHVMFQEGFLNRRSDGAGMHFLVICGNRIDDDRSCFGKPSIVPNGSDYFYAGLDPEEVSLPTLQPFSYYTYWPDMTCCYGNVLFQPSPKTALVGGQWQEVVFHIKLNTPGQSDGLQEVWLDGVQKLDQRNLRWRTTTDVTLNEIRFDNYMPGGPLTQYLWLDDITVWRP
jgi:uncharacterized protein YjdB